MAVQTDYRDDGRGLKVGEDQNPLISHLREFRVSETNGIKAGLFASYDDADGSKMNLTGAKFAGIVTSTEKFGFDSVTGECLIPEGESSKVIYDGIVTVIATEDVTADKTQLAYDPATRQANVSGTQVNGYYIDKGVAGSVLRVKLLDEV
jgi:hypothetical protein